MRWSASSRIRRRTSSTAASCVPTWSAVARCRAAHAATRSSPPIILRIPDVRSSAGQRPWSTSRAGLPSAQNGWNRPEPLKYEKTSFGRSSSSRRSNDSTTQKRGALRSRNPRGRSSSRRTQPLKLAPSLAARAKMTRATADLFTCDGGAAALTWGPVFFVNRQRTLEVTRLDKFVTFTHKRVESPVDSRMNRHSTRTPNPAGQDALKTMILR